MKFYSLEPALSRNPKVCFTIGKRGKGKTYAGKDYGFKKWMIDGSEWVYIRRGDEETNASKINLWDDYLPQRGYETKTKGIQCFIRIMMPDGLEGKEKNDWHEENPWKPFGYYMSLSKAQLYKSGSYPKVKLIIFDEFIIENTRRQYIPGEVDHFMSLIDTISRHRTDVKVFAFSNAGFLSNPYFQYYKIKSSDFINSQFIRRNNGSVLFEYVPVDEEEIANSTSIVAAIANDSYKDYAMRSKFKDGDAELVTTRPADSHPWIKLSQDGKSWLTVYSKPGEKLWVGEGNSNCNAYSLDKWKPIENAVYEPKVISSLKSVLNGRMITFASADVRVLFLNWIKNHI